MTSQQKRLFVYLLVALMLLTIMARVSPVWATSGASHANQTVPTPTRPGSGPPPPPVAPTADPTPPADLPSSVLPSPAPPPQAQLTLGLQTDRVAVWPGVVVRYTLTLANAGQSSAREVELDATLPEGLTPLTAETSAGAAWSGRNLSLSQPVLAPNGRLVVTFAAVVQPGAQQGSVLVTEARASASALASLSASQPVALPPAQLPAVGGSVGFDACLSAR